jgi:hypothetical protein
VHRTHWPRPAGTPSPPLRNYLPIRFDRGGGATCRLCYARELLDTAGFQNLTAAAAITVADFVLVPAMPDASSVLEAVKKTQQVGSLGSRGQANHPLCRSADSLGR